MPFEKNRSFFSTIRVYHKLFLQKRQRSMKSFAKRNTMKSTGIQLPMRKKDSSR